MYKKVSHVSVDIGQLFVDACKVTFYRRGKCKTQQRERRVRYTSTFLPSHGIKQAERVKSKKAKQQNTEDSTVTREFHGIPKME
jgi:hypothetical protein